VQIVGRETTLAMARKGGAYVVATLLSRLREEGEESTRAEVRRWLGDFKEDVAGEDVKGWNWLVEEVKALRQS
jgi:hypothetical protein